MARLIKLLDSSGYKVTSEGSSYCVYSIAQELKCGDGYKNGLSHRFEGTKEQVGLLVKVIRKFNITTLSQIEEKSFVFTSEKLFVQIFVFRICRYIRNESLTNVLNFTLELNNKHKITIHTAFMLSILILRRQGKLMYYNTARDIVVPQLYKINFSFLTLREFREYINDKNIATSYFSDIFHYDGRFTPKKLEDRRTTEQIKELHNKFIKFIDKGNYKSAARLVSKRL